MADAFEDLMDILPEDVNLENHCHPENFRLWEENIATPILTSMGYTELRWRTGERDSWGPLSRIVEGYLDGEVHRLIYG